MQGIYKRYLLRRNVRVFLSCSFASILFVLLCVNQTPPNVIITKEYNESFNEVNHDVIKFTPTKSWKKILIWTDFFRYNNSWNRIFRRLVSHECEESRCLITTDKEEMKNADAVLFNAYNLQDKRKSPEIIKNHIFPMPNRSQNLEQIFIFYSMEAPTRLLQPEFLKGLFNYFNWTMTYRKDSDIVEPFGIVTKRKVKRPLNEIKHVTQSELKERKMVIWIASHCTKIKLKREILIAQLKKHMKVDIFGKCGCEIDTTRGNDLIGETIGNNTSEMTAQNYNFYLALENSLCKDYVTEKIFKAWKLGIIPVVWGAVNYSSFAPPKSYINYEDFGSVAKLAEYLKKVAGDAKLYNEYFRWQEDYDVEVGNPYNSFVCGLCEKLHAQSSNSPAKWYENIDDWFIGKSHCKNNKASKRKI